MSKNIYINNISKNKHDFALGVELPVVSLKINKSVNYNETFLIGLQYLYDDRNCRNLYDKENKELVGVIKYDLNIILQLDKSQKIKRSIKYDLYLNDVFL